MINKFVASMDEALAGIKDDAVVLIGGFGAVGQPNQLVAGLIDANVRGITAVLNNAGGVDATVGLSKLIATGRVRKLVCSFPRSNQGPTVFTDLYRNGQIELELVPQGTLAERLRAAGAGVGAFFTPTAVGTKLAEGKEVREIDGKLQVLEYALQGDVALVEAWQADRWGNLTYKDSGRNFNPVMATAARLTVVQTQHVVELGELNPEHIVTAGIYVDRVLHVPYGDPPL